MRLVEAGRSLTEMLGVLAIVGILSIAGILGYNYAINKHYANDTINQLTQYALIASEQARHKQGVFNFEELGNVTRQGYPIMGSLSENPSYFELKMSKVPPNVCELILKSGWKQPLVFTVNGVAYSGNTKICYQADEQLPATMQFQFDIYLDAGAIPLGACRDNSDCVAGCTACVNGQCETTCSGDERCATQWGKDQQVCCPADKRAGNVCCDIKYNGQCCNGYGQCCPWYKPLVDMNGVCYACDFIDHINVTGHLDNCSVCPNRELQGNLCRMTCPVDKPLRDSYNRCYACDDENIIYVLSNKERCSICPSRILSGHQNGYCGLPCGKGIYANKPLTDMSGVCHACDEKMNFDVFGVTDNCAVCPNRVLTENQCSWPCPADKPLPDNRGSCYACDTPSPVYAPRSCTICPEREVLSYRCILKCGEGIYADKPLPDSAGKCWGCFEQEAINVQYNRDNCSKICPNRYLEETVCLLNKCDPNEVQDIYGKCFSCDTPNTEVIDVYRMISTCQKSCPNRMVVSRYCALPCGEGIYGDKPLSDRYGKCYSCDEPSRIDVYEVTQNCAICPNRKLDGNACVLK